MNTSTASNAASNAPHSCTPAQCTYVEAGAGEMLAIVGDRVRVLADAGVTGGAATVFETITSPGMGPPLHVHTREDEMFYILDGRATFALDGRTINAMPGAFVFAPRGSKHTFVACGETPLRMIVIVTPSGLETPFRGNAELFKANPQAGPAEIAAIFAKHELSFVGPPLSAE